MESCAWRAHLLLFRLTNLCGHMMQHATMPAVIRESIERANVLVPPTTTVVNVRKTCVLPTRLLYCIAWHSALRKIHVVNVTMFSYLFTLLFSFLMRVYDAACTNIKCNPGQYRTGQCSGTTNNYSCKSTREHICLLLYIVQYLLKYLANKDRVDCVTLSICVHWTLSLFSDCPVWVIFELWFIASTVVYIFFPFAYLLV